MPSSSSRRPWLIACLSLSMCGSACNRKETAPSPPSSTSAAPAPSAAKAGGTPENLEYGRSGEPVHLVVGYQPYYTEAWSGIVVNGLGLWKKHLPPGSTVDFSIGLQGAIIVNAMLAGKQQIGYLGDTPSIVGATKRSVADLRIVANIGLGTDQCNVFFTRKDAPKFESPDAALKWLDGKTVAVPKGSCTDRFARAVFKKKNITPKEYLNQNIELITSGFRVGKLDAAVVWEPVASRLVTEGLARRVATGNDVGENDGAFISARADLLQQRPDVIKAWLEAELEGEQYLADPKNARDVVRMVKEQTTGFDEKALNQALFGSYPANEGGAPLRLTIPFGFTPQSLELLKRGTAFLFEVKSIDVPELPQDAVQGQFTDEILKAHGLTAPVGEVRSISETASK